MFTIVPLKLSLCFVLVLALLSSAFSIAVSIFSSKILQTLGRIFVLVFISSLLSFFVMQGTLPGSISPGQSIKGVIEITARVLDDSREISGGQSIFPVEILSAGDINLTETSASGELTVASGINLYKGQVLRLWKRNILIVNSSIIFVDRKNITVLGWEESWTAKILRKRARILESLKNRIGRLGTDASVLFTALFVGIKENPNGVLFSSLRKAGASHILALSGMHLGIISFGIMFLLTALLGKRLSFECTLLFILFYVFLTDAGPSLTRAAILFVLIGLFGLSGKKIDIFHVLTLCFLIQILLDPVSVYELSFQLSYLALGGIILGGGGIDRILPGFIPTGVRGVFAASISAQLFTAPLVLHYFGVMYPIGIISGIILVPIITLFIWIGIITLLPMPWFFQNFLFMLMDNLYKAIKIVADFFSQFPGLEKESAIWLGCLLFIIYIGFVFFRLRTGILKMKETVFTNNFNNHFIP